MLLQLPSHSAVALFSLDFADVVQLSTSAADRRRSFRISPLKCRDLAATLEFDISWDYVPPPPASSPSPSAKTTSSPTTGLHMGGGGGALAGLPPSSTLLHKAARHYGTTDTTASSLSSRRTTASMSSQGSERELLDDLANCSGCRQAKRRLERKDVQVVQLETFLKESQKRLDALALEGDELAVRERGETQTALRYRALSLRMLQELEVAFQFCAAQVQTADGGGAPLAGDEAFRFLPQFEFMDRVKRLHAELARVNRGAADADSNELELDEHEREPRPEDPIATTIDVDAELLTALTRNRKLQRDLEYLGRAVGLSDAALLPPALQSEGPQGPEAEERASPVRSMTEQLNAMERENRQLRAQLEQLAHATVASLKGLRSAPPSETAASETTSTSRSSSAADLVDMSLGPKAAPAGLDDIRETSAAAALEDELAQTKAELAALRLELEAARSEPVKVEEAPVNNASFLEKIYQDVGKAKAALEEQVRQLNALLVDAAAENARLRAELEQRAAEAAPPPVNDEDSDKVLELQAQVDKMQRELQAATAQLEASDARVETKAKELRAAQSQAAALDAQVAALNSQVAALELQTKEVVKEVVVKEATVAAGAEDGGELQKQLKLARQEVMQLRYRSNQLESVHEKLEESLKEKRALQAKLTALEGQLYEQRSRALPPDNGAVDEAARVKELEAKLERADREADALRGQLDRSRADRVKERAASSDRVEERDLDAVQRKVAAFEGEISRLLERNETQAQRIEALSIKVRAAANERQELEHVLMELTVELDRVERTYGGLAHDDEHDDDEHDDEHDASARVANKRVADRYAPSLVTVTASAVGESPVINSRRKASSSGTSSRIAALMKNFSPAAGDVGAMPSPVGAPAVKRPVKLDFRSRNGSTASSVASRASRTPSAF